MNLKMIEIVGTSDESFSDACKNGIKTIINKGEKIHFFEVMQQRGSVKNNENIEYQVVLKAAVEY